MVLSLGKQYELAGQQQDRLLHPPPGEMVDISGRALHVQKQGNAGPAVILESGIAATCLSWRLVDSEIAKFATVYSYDRAGFGWSPHYSSPKIARALVEEMRLTMAAAGAPTPRIVVGHSYGGMLMRMYAAMYPQEVSAVVLVDALPPEEWFPLDRSRTATLSHAQRLARRGAWLADRGVVRYALTSLGEGRTLVPRILSLLGGVAGVNASSRVGSFILKLPMPIRHQVRAHWCRADSFRCMERYLADLPASCAQAQLCDDLYDIPLIVLSAEFGRKGHQGRQAKLAKLSKRGDFRVVPGTSHWIMLDDPSSVIEAVKDCVDLIQP